MRGRGAEPLVLASIENRPFSGRPRRCCGSDRAWVVVDRAQTRKAHIMSERKTEVLVVGAGPTGLLTALLLAEAGIEVQIIDRKERTAAHSYACALHGKTLKLLHGLGLADSILERGRRVHTMAFYDGESRRGETRFSELGGEYPFLVVLPQSDLEAIL